jgi:hypothetical protein
MSPTHEPIRQLEPRNLLEPLDLPEPGPERADFTPPPNAPERRWTLKPALVVAGALICVATGAALPQLAALTRGDTKVSQTVGSAMQPVEPKPGASARSGPIEASSGEAVAGGASEVAPPAVTAVAPANAPTSAAPRPWVDPVPKDAAAGQPRSGAPVAPTAAAPPTTPTVGGTAPATMQPNAQANPPLVVVPRVESRGHSVEGAQSSRESARATERRQSRDGNRRDGERRLGDRAPRDETRMTGKTGREDERGRFGEAGEDDRVIGRAPPAPREGERRRVLREDGRTVGRAPRDDDGAPDRIVRDERPMLPFPFFGGFWGAPSRSGD